MREDGVSIQIYSGVYDAIVEECDRFDTHETGGALIGTYRYDPDIGLVITVSGVIDAGPKARRTAVSFFKDGEYQEKIFRQIERRPPDIEHLGNWHTHHVNGYPTLSPGDCTTYHKNVNSSNHNTDFWYALLITQKTVTGYRARHYVLYRNDPREYEVKSVAQVNHPAHPY